MPTGACGTITATISCGAPRRMPFRTLRVLLATQSVETCIPTLEWCDPRRLDNYPPTLPWRPAFCIPQDSGR
ncbi:hypothetical protein CXB42_11270 [Pseudomonas syringae pv. syringae]|uniref:Uncharacterized protein n=1 Tax=Pseudomonas syringae pv. syringae TaxID=321 RepID=A0AAE5S8J5_PSESY|nr:hypothetical protein CXB42_11270 [Pseudomonas syringae pv. syringae]